MPQHRSDLVLGQYHGDTLRLLCAHHLVNPANVLLEDLLVQKQDGAQRLALRGRGDTAFDGQMRQELLDLLHAHLARMPFAVEHDKASHPADIGLFGPQAIVAGTHHPAHLIQELGVSLLDRPLLPAAALERAV